MTQGETEKRNHCKPAGAMAGRLRYEHSWIMKLRRIPQFPELVRRLVRGDTAWSVSKWLATCPARGELSGCSFETLRKYLTALAVRVRENADRTPRLNLSDFEKAAVHAHLQAKVTAAVQDLPDPAGFDDLRKTVTEEAQKLDAATMLRYCFMIQQQRVMELRELEKKTKMPLPYGDRIVRTLMRIAAEIRKLELGEAVLRKDRMSEERPFSGGPAPYKQTEPSEEWQAFAQLDAVDRNLIRDATARAIDLIQREVSAATDERMGSKAANR